MTQQIHIGILMKENRKGQISHDADASLKKLNRM